MNIIDTPGLADTEGSQKDEEHLKKITQYLIDLGEFNAVCLVMKGSTTRATPSICYVIDEIRSILPKDVKDNFIVCVTSQSTPVSKDFKGVLSQLKLETAQVITFENSAYQEFESKPDEDEIEQIKFNFERNHKSFKKLVEKASGLPHYRSDGIRQIKDKRNKLKEEIALMMLTIDDCTAAKHSLTDWLAN